MKSLVLALVIVCAAAVGGTIIYLNRQKAAPTPVVESQPVETNEPPPVEKTVVPKTESEASRDASTVAQIPVSTPPVNEPKSNDSTNAISKAVDALLSSKNGAQKHPLFDQLRKSGQLEQAIAELKQRMADSPTNVEIPTTLGEAQLNKLRGIKETGGDYNEIGILAMQADQNFNAALKIDPKNWEAQFVKAASMYYWPAEATRDNEVVLRLSSLIDQQEAMPSDPVFAQTYAVLGEQFRKIGQPDKAEVTWRLGLQKFPSDATLQKKIASSAH